MNKGSMISLLYEEKRKVCDEAKEHSLKVNISNTCLICYMGSKDGTCSFDTVANYFNNCS